MLYLLRKFFFLSGVHIMDYVYSTGAPMKKGTKTRGLGKFLYLLSAIDAQMEGSIYFVAMCKKEALKV